MAMPRVRRTPDSEVLANSMTGSESCGAMRGSRTTLISGSGLRSSRSPARSTVRGSCGASSLSLRALPRSSLRAFPRDAIAADGRWPRERHHSKPAMPAMNNTPTTSRMMRRSSIALRSRHAHRLVDVDGHEARATGFGHGDAEQLLGKLHGGLVVRDEDELHALRHCLDDVAEPADVVLVERRVHFVQQAERGGIQVEDREHQRHGGQRLLAARELVDAAVALAGRPGHD